MKPSQNRFSPFIKEGEQQQPFLPLYPTRFEKKKLEEKRRKGRRRRKGEEGGEGLVRLEIKEEHKFEIETLRSRFKVGFLPINYNFIKGIRVIG